MHSLQVYNLWGKVTHCWSRVRLKKTWSQANRHASGKPEQYNKLTKSIQMYSKISHDSTASIACQLYLPPPQPCLTLEPKLPSYFNPNIVVIQAPSKPKAQILESCLNPPLRMCVFFGQNFRCLYLEGLTHSL